MTVLDLLTRPELVQQAWDYFKNVQTKDVKYIPFLKSDTPPPTHLNADILAKYREQMKKFYYDPTKYGTYLEQLGHQVPDGSHDAIVTTAVGHSIRSTYGPVVQQGPLYGVPV